MPLPTFAILFAGLYLPNNGPIGICALRIIAIGAQVVFVVQEFLSSRG